MVDIKAFRKWQQTGMRTVSITLGQAGDKEYIRIWAYDYGLMIGQHVESVDEIDLDKVAKKELEEKINQLQKLTGEGGAN
jgi:hypothetical protein